MGWGVSGHTPGPWLIGEQNGHCGVSIDETSEDGARVATVYLGIVTSAASWGEEHFALPENAEAMANARLIAAAPELLEALQEHVDECFDDMCEMCARHEKIIAKVLGE